MKPGYCSECEFKTPHKRKYGISYSCDKECTHMNVTFFTRERHVNRKNLLCPLLKKKGEID